MKRLEHLIFYPLSVSIIITILSKLLTRFSAIIGLIDDYVTIFVLMFP